MKITYGSDIHLNHERGNKHTLDIPTGELLILAGDTFEPWWPNLDQVTMYSEFFEEIASKFEKIVIIAGNHEHYGGYLIKTIDKIQEYTKEYPNIIVLDSQYFQYKNCLIFGSTFWTDMRGSDPIVMFDSQRNMSDYSYVSYSEDVYNPYNTQKAKLCAEDTIRENDWARKKLVEFLSKSEELDLLPIIVTHMQLSWECVDSMYRHDNLSYAYANLGLDDLLADAPKGTIVISGHMHKSDIIEIGNSMIYTNARGYVGCEAAAKSFEFKEIEIGEI